VDNIKLPIALVLAMAAQLAAGVWWVSQQASTIADLEETVSQLGSRMAIEDNVNLKRDVLDNSMELEYVWNELEEIWDELASMAMTINEINKIKQRVAIIENDIKYIGRDHLDMKGGMK
jgi:DNA repair exonuclease SbcCD ATPase subunit